MDSKVCLTPFTRDYGYLKLCDIWASLVYFQSYQPHPSFKCKPSAFFVYSSTFKFKGSKTKTTNLVIDLIYAFKPMVSKIIPFSSYVTTCSFAKDPFKPILFVGLKSGDCYVLNLDNLNDIKMYKANIKKINKPVIMADWLDDKTVIFACFDQLFFWNIDKGLVDVIFESPNLLEKLTFVTCTSFKPALIAVGLATGVVIIFKEVNGKFETDHVFRYHTKEICSLSFTVSNIKNYPYLASICSQGWLVVWNLKNKTRSFEDKCLKRDEADSYRNYTCFFTDDQFDVNKTKAPSREHAERSHFNKQIEYIRKENHNYFILIASDSNGILHEYKVPKFSNVNKDAFTFQRKAFRLCQPKYTKVFLVLMPRSFQINLKAKPQKEDSFQLVNNNNYPIMIHVSNKNSYFNFLTYDYYSRKFTESIPLLANSVSSIEFNPVHPNLVAVPDTGGFITWHLPSFDNGIMYNLYEHRKGFFKQFPIRVTCFNWHPKDQNIIVIGTRAGQVYVYNIVKQEPIFNKFYLGTDQCKSPYIYSIYWGPNVLEDKKKFPEDNPVGVSKAFDFIYCLLENRLVIINTETRAYLKLVDISDIYIDKQWTEMCWKKDFRMLAVGSNEGTIDIFKHSLIVFYKLKHLLTIELFNGPIHSICWHPITSKPNENENRFNTEFENVIAVASTGSSIRVIDLRMEIKMAENEAEGESINLPLIVNRVDYVLNGHEQRVYRMCFSTFKEMYLLSTSEDATVRIWDLKNDINNYLVLTYYGHFSRTIAARWSLTVPDLVLSGGFDSIFSVWYAKDQTNEKPNPIKVIQSSVVNRL